MYQVALNVFSFLIGVFGEAIVLRFVARVKFWYATMISEEMKAKVDQEYSVMFPESNDLGNPTPPDEKPNP